MKNNIIIKVFTSAFLLLLATTGCEKAFEDALDRADDSRETLEGMLGDADKIRGMLSAAYMGIPHHRSDIYFWTTEESLTDNCFDFQGQSMENWRSGLLSPSFPAVWASSDAGNPYMQPTGGSFWGRYWGAIRHCNSLIDNMDKITVPLSQLPQEDRDLIKDEAIALRAYFHIKLISMYGPLPFMESNPTVQFDGWKTMTRPTYDEIANRIADELQGVIDRGVLPMKRVGENDKRRVPMGFVYGLKSRVLLYNASPLNNPGGDVAKYEAAAAAAKQFLDLGDVGGKLVPWEDTKKLYTSPMSADIEATEMIWRARDRNPQLSNVHGMDLTATVPKRCNFTNHKAGETPSQEMVDCYELKNGALIIQQYDASHANPTFTPEALAAGYDDLNDPYANRDDRFYRDILFNGNYFGESYDMGDITVWTYLGAPGTGTNGNSTSGDQKRTYTGYYYGKDRDPEYYGSDAKGNAFNRMNQHSVLMRYAEIWLNYAEALCGAGRFDEACNALDKTRLRANQPSIKDVPDYAAGDNTWLMKRIRNERRVELVLEDHRFYDVRRWNLISDQNNNAISGMLVEKDGSAYKHTRYQMPFTWACHNEKYKVLPIPIDDKKLLPSMEQPKAWQ